MNLGKQMRNDFQALQGTLEFSVKNKKILWEEINPMFWV